MAGSIMARGWNAIEISSHGGAFGVRSPSLQPPPWQTAISILGRLLASFEERVLIQLPGPLARGGRADWRSAGVTAG